jgi:hypothetical protein
LTNQPSEWSRVYKIIAKFLATRGGNSVSFFKWSKLDGLAFDSIDEETTWLELLFEKSEVLEVVKGMNRNKAPSPDAFTLLLWLSSKLVGI